MNFRGVHFLATRLRQWCLACAASGGLMFDEVVQVLLVSMFLSGSSSVQLSPLPGEVFSRTGRSQVHWR